MTTSVPDESTKLRAVIAAFPHRGFAVVDGAHFEDLPALLRTESLFARSLFLDHADKEVEAAGPWLIGLDQSSDALDRVQTVVGDRPAAVYWCCAADELVLHRHLRTLNIARIPTWAADERPPPAEAEINEPSIQRVAKESGDPNRYDEAINEMREYKKCLEKNNLIPKKGK